MCAGTGSADPINIIKQLAAKVVQIGKPHNHVCIHKKVVLQLSVMNILLVSYTMYRLAIIIMMGMQEHSTMKYGHAENKVMTPNLHLI